MPVDMPEQPTIAQSNVVESYRKAIEKILRQTEGLLDQCKKGMYVVCPECAKKVRVEVPQTKGALELLDMQLKALKELGRVYNVHEAWAHHIAGDSKVEAFLRQFLGELKSAQPGMTTELLLQILFGKPGSGMVPDDED